MFVVVLTGGIGSGKSAVADIFAQQGVDIIDTDIIARDLVAPGQPALSAITEHFGHEVLNADGSLNRGILRAHVFNHPKDRQWLEHLLHPMIQQAVKNQLTDCTGPYALVVIPLLTKNYRQAYPFVDRICVVDCDENMQIERTVSRDNITQAMAQQILDTQISREERLALATDVILNNSDLSALTSKVMAMHNKYLALCNTKS